MLIASAVVLQVPSLRPIHAVRSGVRVWSDGGVFEECRKPIIAAIHGACIGGTIDMVTAYDLRYCTHVCSLVVGVVIFFRSTLQSSSVWNDN